MEAAYKIGELAKAADVPISTVRYYDGRGLLPPETRTRSSYRLYGEVSLTRLRFIRAAQASGFTLEDIRLLLDLRDGQGDPCGEVRDIVASRLDAVSEQLRELRHVQRVLKETLAWCDKPRAKGCCPAIDKLDAAAARRRRASR